MLNKTLSMIALLAVGAMAQTATPAKPGSTQTPAVKSSAPAKPASQTVTKPAASPAKTALKPTSKTAPAAKPVAQKAKPKVQSPEKVKAEIQAAAAKPAAVKPASVKTAGRRDPFVSPLRLQEDKMKGSAVCTTGARCLIVDQVVLKGIVKTPQGMIAMVENATQKQYNLREKDPVLNGQVVKITGDSVIFRETVTDTMGKQTTREVVKKVTAPVI